MKPPSKYLAFIGRKGGAAGTGAKKARTREQAQAAARTRWAKWRAAREEERPPPVAPKSGMWADQGSWPAVP